MVNKKYLYWIIPLVLLIGILLGIWICITGDNYMMGDYKLYQCVYNNADLNDFTSNPYLVNRIQEECICFFQNNFTNILEKC